MKEGRGLAEQVRRREVARALGKMNLSPDEEKAVERFSHSLVGKLFRGPISEVIARVEVEKQNLAQSPQSRASAATEPRARRDSQLY